MGGKKKYIEMFGSFTEPFNFHYMLMVEHVRGIGLEHVS